MDDEQFIRADERFEAAATSTAPATKGYTLRQIKVAVDAVGTVLKSQFGKVREREESTVELLADLDRRLAELERRQ